MLLAILIPVYNEANRLEDAVRAIDESTPPSLPTGEPLSRHLFFTDDGSTDGSAELITKLAERDDITAITHDRNQGKGAAIRSALDAALDANADLVLIHDADLEYDPADHADVLAPILTGRADAVIGSRFIGRSHRVLYYWHAIANRIITTLSNMLTNLNLTDIECCSKAFTREVAQNITINEPRFGLEPELIAKLAKMRIPGEDQHPRKLRIYEVAVTYAGRTYAEGKKIGWKDAVRAIYCICKYRIRG